MKKIIIATIVLLGFYTIKGQVGMGKASVDGDAILDFPLSNTGIILPIVEALPTGIAASNGTFLLDKTDNIVKMRENDLWVPLSDAGSLTGTMPNTSAEQGGGVIIGAPSSPAQGVLVLESASRALVLPKVNDPVGSMKSPIAGTMCYDTVSKTMAVFDGVKWSFWK
ncbi:hypothetical protein HHL23_21995 [Chryseobacterium sp. RP-3-3]|uniref:Uncharacterized protein n=1 Tax=Chryseobacterium antibioticum TaxID=2728847 RepID=A0A7Y0AS01_9FLAO|nr:hypothetical protein [Chryseobacterium antibioticum]NML72431.1 hypothetical protein [Chryseobacterium antibioticum]